MRTPAKDPAAARWLRQRLLEPWSSPGGGNPVGAIVPSGFAAYARVFHDPALSGTPRIRWSDVAASTGRAAHPLMEWHRITTPAPGSGRRAWNRADGEPIEGEPSAAELEALVAVLSGFTSTPERCWYCSWTGFGGTEETGAEVRLPDRTYFLSSGPIAAATGFEEQPPNIWWPDDRAWCVASEIDLRATYVGGGDGCIESVLVAEALEAMPVSVSDRVDADADVVNRD